MDNLICNQWWGGSVVLGGGRVLGKKDDYENNDLGSVLPSK